MKKHACIFIYSILFFSHSFVNAQSGELNIRLNQAGYLPGDIKSTVVFSNVPVNDLLFYVRDANELNEAYSGLVSSALVQLPHFLYSYNLDFSALTRAGHYILDIDGYYSFPFIISDHIYNHITDSLMLFLKAQRCGPTKPYLHQPCHLSDAVRIIENEFIDSAGADLTGGWHDAGDYIKFLLTTAYTTYMLIFAYEFDEAKFSFDNDNNSVPDILEEARVGIDWLLRANYKKGKLITQVQDLRDHTSVWRLPENDSLRFDRPAYSGISKNQIGMYAAALALAARVWEKRFYDHEFAQRCLSTAEEIYSIRDSVPDLDKSPSGAYQDKEYQGKMALASAELYLSTSKNHYLSEASEYLNKTSAEYWWSWGNINALSYYRLAEYFPENVNLLKENLNHFNELKERTLFNEGTDYSWGTTHALLGITLQAILFKKLTGDNSYDSLAVYQRDYILGRNPWGLTFITSIGSDYPKKLHSQLFFLNGGNLPGALAAGPAPLKLLNSYSINRTNDKYKPFNNEAYAYYDDFSDYITNEAAITSNATAIFVFGYYSSR